MCFVFPRRGFSSHLLSTWLHNHRGSLCRSFVVAMAFSASPAVMGDGNSIMESPGSAPKLVFGSQPPVPIVPPLQPCPIVPSVLDTSQDLPISIAPRGNQ